MKKIVYNLIFIPLFLLLFFCERTLDIDIQTDPPKIAVSALFTSDSLWQLKLSNTAFIFDEVTSSKKITDATVKITNNNTNTSFTLPNDGTFYRYNKKPISGHSYTINVTHPNYPEASATSKVPYPFDIRGISEESQVTLNFFDGNTFLRMDLDIKFEEEQGEENYYMLEVTRKGTVFDIDPLNPSNVFEREEIVPVEIRSTNPGVLSSGGQDRISLLFNDQFLNDNNGSFNFSCYEILLDLADEYDTITNTIKSYKVSDKYYFYLTKMNKDLYNYSGSFDNYTTNNNPFALQPPRVISNIENGVGIFAGYTTSVDSLEIKYKIN